MPTIISISDARALGVEPANDRTHRKYRNVPTVVDGITFDSKAEARRWSDLMNAKRAGMIKDIRRQVPYRLEVNGVLIATYKADFVVTYVDGVIEVEDVKGGRKRGTRTRDYVMKKKLMQAIHGIEIKEVTKK